MRMRQFIPPTPEACATYMFYDHDKVVYVGMSNNPLQRWGQHVRNSPWCKPELRVEVKWWRNRHRAERVESQLIRILDPQHNRLGVPVESNTPSRVDKRQLMHDLKRDNGIAYNYSMHRLPPIVIRMLQMALDSDHDVETHMLRRNDEAALLRRVNEVFANN